MFGWWVLRPVIKGWPPKQAAAYRSPAHTHLPAQVHPDNLGARGIAKSDWGDFSPNGDFSGHQ